MIRKVYLLQLLVFAAAMAGRGPFTPSLAQTSFQPMSYHLEPVENLKSLQSRFSPQELLLLEKLNRRDLDHLVRLKNLVVPNQWFYNELLYSPLPDTWAWAAQYPKALVVCQQEQVFGAYENGRLVRWGPVSSGRKTDPTPTGLYNLKWKAKVHTSTDNDDWIMPWYFNFINFRGLGFHQYELPGYPASHACVRLLEEDAIWIYNWGEQWQLDPKGETVVKPGTPVLVLGPACYDDVPPWRSPQFASARVQLPIDPATEPPQLSGP